MKSPILITVFVMFTYCLIGQSSRIISLEYDNQKISSQSYTKLKEILTLSPSSQGLEFISSQNSVINVVPQFKKSSTKTIEGMDSKKIAKTTVIIKLKNVITLNDTLIKKEYEIAAKNEYEIDKELLDKLSLDEKFISSINNIILVFIDKAEKECGKHIEKVKENEPKNLTDAMKMYMKIENSLPNCAQTNSAYKSDLSKKYDKFVCDKMLYDANIYINSGVEYQMNKAVNILLQIPPTAECRSEALKLSEQLSAKMNITKVNAEALKEYQRLMKSNDSSGWGKMLNGN